MGNKRCVQARQLEQTIARHIAGAARRNLSRSVAIRSASLKRPLIGLSSSWMERSSRQKSSQLSGNELIAIFVTILKRSKCNLLILPSSSSLSKRSGYGAGFRKTSAATIPMHKKPMIWMNM